MAVSGGQGYPYLVQLVGFGAWKADRAASQVSLADVQGAVETAQRKAGRMIHEPALNDLSDVDRDFLHAMSTLRFRAAGGLVLKSL